MTSCPSVLVLSFGCAMSITTPTYQTAIESIEKEEWPFGPAEYKLAGFQTARTGFTHRKSAVAAVGSIEKVVNSLSFSRASYILVVSSFYSRRQAFCEPGRKQKAKHTQLTQSISYQQQRQQHGR